MDGWMDGQTDRQMVGQTDGWVYGGMVARYTFGKREREEGYILKSSNITINMKNN